MILSYNTNGFAHHSLDQTIEVLASLGYGGVSITIDHSALNPLDSRNVEQLDRTANLLQKCNLRCDIETGCRFLLDPLHKHEPTLVSPDERARGERVAFYRYAIDVAARLNAGCVSLWSGVVPDGASHDEALERLLPALREVLDHAAERGVTVALEPEPGMLIDTVAAYRALAGRVEAASELRLTLDVGHLHCNGELPVVDTIRAAADQIVNVHIEDMRAGAHEHLRFGHGEIDFPPVIAALQESGYEGPLSVELSRHSHMAPTVARESFEFLSPLIG
ncbi:L-ribulose-5-phosphate 3-epimerase UlaE [Posidoniimonas polymericola]|uniref:L-ribulose-5-phosphate 3-epimerase UlaE n=1 Tax=Posidoniimonas polymericola TaxID=2528002 RepID=A0A5C5YMJ7_9BACT|nr:sugar phosphate isomerase/epimerase family protein [Posidoniimonas polymericola]TWT75988.1 L-ribulose-5-phosphate 3-epimerase UlaE [Posidoniimonas polymericola]